MINFQFSSAAQHLFLKDARAKNVPQSAIDIVNELVENRRRFDDNQVEFLALQRKHIADGYPGGTGGNQAMGELFTENMNLNKEACSLFYKAIVEAPVLLEIMHGKIGY